MPMANQGSHSEAEIVVETSITITTQNQRTFISSLIGNRIKITLNSILTRFHAGYFRISLSLGGQALLWKTLMSPMDHDREIDSLRHPFRWFQPTCFLVLWFFAFFVLSSLSVLYILRCMLFFKKVKAEFLHNVGVNYLFAPSISWLLLLQSAPFMSPKTVSYLVLWWAFAVPVLMLDVKIYGQWFTKGKRFLSTVANPTSQISVTGNLVGAQAAANMGWKESAVCLFSLGMVHYLVLFVTLYQRLSGSHRLPAMLRPVFFLFCAAPSVACLAWEAIFGDFDIASKMLFFLSLFLFVSLVCRPILFKRSMRRFNIAWWAYSFPVSVLALASAEYANEVKCVIAHGIMLLLSAFSVLVCLGLALLSLLNAKLLLHDNNLITEFNRLPIVSPWASREKMSSSFIN